MLLIDGQAAYCRAEAARCRKRGLCDLARHWLKLAETYELAERVSGYIEWQARRVEPPPGFEHV
jgi:hypothetical protein